MSELNANDRIMERLVAWGCDVEDALPRFVNNRDFYLRLLALVPTEEGFEKLGLCLAAGNAKGAFEQAHALKGVLGNMGLTPMYQEVCAIVEPLRAGCMDDVPRRFETLLQQKAKLESILADRG